MLNTLLPAVEINPPQSAKASIIWLHGLGADGHDFANIVPELHLPPELGVRFVFPHAPLRPVTINGGMRMPAWFDIYGLNEHSPIDEVGIRETQQAIQQLIEHEIATGIPSSRIVLAGFSQGGAVALVVGLTFPQPLAGILGLSTFLSAHVDLTKIVHPANQATPIFLTHGTFDPIVPLSLGEWTRDALSKTCTSVTWHTYPMAHQVCPAEISDIAVWLKARLS
ncbi:MAG: carboxylesterase [Gammaproteobacteria bacterium]